MEASKEYTTRKANPVDERVVLKLVLR